MDLLLKRDSGEAAGVFGVLSSKDGSAQIDVTLEHAYPVEGAWVPKVAPGTYTCKRHAPNRLPYETFELQGVPNFQGQPVVGILIHIGNFDKDSEGCILLGASKSGDMICGSKKSFDAFMKLQTGLDTFQLVVE